LFTENDDRSTMVRQILAMMNKTLRGASPAPDVFLRDRNGMSAVRRRLCRVTQGKGPDRQLKPAERAETVKNRGSPALHWPSV
jgi:hypothetical protein